MNGVKKLQLYRGNKHMHLLNKVPFSFSMIAYNIQLVRMVTAFAANVSACS